MIVEEKRVITQADVAYDVRFVGNGYDLISIEDKPREAEMRVIDHDIWVCSYSFKKESTGVLFWKKQMYHNTWMKLKASYAYDYFGVRELAKDIKELLAEINKEQQEYHDKLQAWAETINYGLATMDKEIKEIKGYLK